MVVFILLKKICGASSVCVTQTTRRLCLLQTVCYSDNVSLKNVCSSYYWCRLGLVTSNVCRRLNTTTHHHRPPPSPTVRVHDPPPSTTIVHHHPPSTFTTHHHRPPPPSMTTVRISPAVHFRSLHTLKKRTVLFLQTSEL
ncbi:hypothetical protein Hanom_Chr12g01086121 [Helianthus anomalus]